MNLNDGEGIAFYEFPEIPDEKAFKAQYRQSMDAASVDDAMVAQIVEEANHAFGLNMEMFKELEGNLIKAIGQMLFNSLTSRRRRGSTELATAE
jgi:heme oxygenase